MHINTKHKSGKNISNKVRITLGVRFHDMQKKFNNGNEIYFYNKTNKQFYI